MIEAGPDEKIYPVAKIAVVFDALADAGVPTEEALARVSRSRRSTRPNRLRSKHGSPAPTPMTPGTRPRVDVRCA